MRKVKLGRIPAATLLVALCVLANGHVFAQATPASTKAMSHNEGTSVAQASPSSSAPSQSDNGTITPGKLRELQQKGETEAAQMRSEHVGKHTAAKKTGDRHKLCEAHKHGLTTSFNGIITNAQKAQTRIDGIYGKALTYQSSKNIQTSHLLGLITTADSSKATSATSIAALKAVKPTIDCNNVSVTSDVATFRAATKEARDNLKAYRTSVKAVMKALHTGKTTTKESTKS